MGEKMIEFTSTHHQDLADREIISESADVEQATRDLVSNLIATVSDVAYVARIMEWWFTDRDNPLSLSGGNNIIDTWKWTADVPVSVAS